MIAAVILAAGTSSRMGEPKQLLPFGGRPMLAAVAEGLLKAPLDLVAVVLGHRAGEVALALEGLPVKVVVNSDYGLGQSTSLKAGLAALGGTAEAVLFVLGDQPLVRPETVTLLIENYRISGGIVAPVYLGRRGNPVLFGSEFFSEIMSLEGDTGAREIILRHPERVWVVEVGDPGVVIDIDTREDYLGLT